ncbi:protein phosphatase 1 regulatory subunit 36-like isoform X1 [Pomacea canaliculata]|nr:protein phosphatase 1 regulatory subunit 36-like isoform X1 [Pomacea canaliculata]
MERSSSNVPTSGKWTWKEDICGLEFVSYSPNADKGKRGKKLDARRGLEGTNRPSSSRGPHGRGQGHYHMATGTKSKKDQAEHTSVLLDDIKAVAVDMIFDTRSIPESFDSLLWTEQFDYFLLHLLSYFNCFFEKIHQDSKKNGIYM